MRMRLSELSVVIGVILAAIMLPMVCPQLAAAQAQVVKEKGKASLNQNLVSHWNANENTQDPKGKNRGFWVNSQGSYSASLRGLGKAFNFAGNGEFVAVPHASNLDMNNEVSLAFWVKPDSTNLMNICCQGLVTTDFYAVEISGGASDRVGINFFVNTGEGFVHTSDSNGGGAEIAPGLWHHVAGTYDGAILQLYVDGQPWGNSVGHIGTIQQMLDGSFLAIGSEDGRATCSGCIGTRYFNGLIDEVRLYSRALTANEVQSLADTKP